MQTFLPYSDFDKCARCLDRQRLGKQRVEVWQILKTLNGESNGWRNHPAVLMWNGYVEALVEYGVSICDEWLRRGYLDKMRERIIAQSWGGEVVLPSWLRSRRLHDGYRSNLVCKYPQHYRQFFPRIPDDIPYYWPVRSN